MRRNIMVAMIALAALCLFAPVTEAKADTTNSVTDNSTYTVTIPAEVTIPNSGNTTRKSATIPISANLASKTNLVMKITSANYDEQRNTFNLVNAESGSRITYSISDNKPLVFSNEGDENETQNYNLTVTFRQSSFTYSGDYTDVLTFTMSSEQKIDTADENHYLTFNINADNDKTASISTTEKVLKNGEKYGTLPTPRRTGYDFKGWYTSKEAADEKNSNCCVDENTVAEKNANLYAGWEIHTFRNTTTFWAWGLNGEGNNGPGTAIRLGKNGSVSQTTQYNASYEFSTQMATDAGIEVPNGYELKEFGSATVGDNYVWQRYKFIFGQDKIGRFSGTQPDWTVNAEYEYDLIKYEITYDLGENGINNPDNPKSYNVLYGVTFKEPTREGYTFDGWYIDNQKVTGINEDCDNNFRTEEGYSEEAYAEAASNFYERLKGRKTGNVIVKAHWIENSSISTKESNVDSNTHDGDIDNIANDESQSSDSLQIDTDNILKNQDIADPKKEDISQSETESTSEEEETENVKVDALPETTKSLIEDDVILEEP